MRREKPAAALRFALSYAALAMCDGNGQVRLFRRSQLHSNWFAICPRPLLLQVTLRDAEGSSSRKVVMIPFCEPKARQGSLEFGRIDYRLGILLEPGQACEQHSHRLPLASSATAAVDFFSPKRARKGSDKCEKCARRMIDNLLSIARLTSRASREPSSKSTSFCEAESGRASGSKTLERAPSMLASDPRRSRLAV